LPFAPVNVGATLHQVQPGPSHRDATQVPLPEDNDDDFPPADQILHQVARPASRVAGSHCADPKGKGKGKAKATDQNAAESSKKVPTGVKRKGRQAGASNYNEEDLDSLLEHARELLPLGEKGWKDVAEVFNRDATAAGRSVRTHKSLETKFKQVCFFALQSLIS
jgi:hypothetical protein